MVDEETKKALLSELDAMQQELDTLAKFQPTTQTLSLLLFSGMLFVVLFFVTILNSGLLIKLVALLSYVIAVGLLFPVVQVTLFSKQPTIQGLGVGGVVLLAVGFVLLWYNFLSTYSVLVGLLLTALFLLFTLIAAVALFAAYLTRQEFFLTKILFIWLCTLASILAVFVFTHVLAFFIAVLLFLYFTQVLRVQLQHARKPLEEKKNWLQKKKEREAFAGFDQE